MIKRKEEKKVFDFFVCKKEPFEILYLKNSQMMTYEQADILCTELSKPLASENLCIGFDLTINR